MRLFPRTLSVRLFLVVLGGVILAIAVSNSLHRRDRSRVVQELREYAALGHMLDVVHLLAPLDPATRLKALQGLSSEKWSIDLGSRADDSLWEPAAGLAGALAERLAETADVEGAWLERPAGCDEGEPAECRNSVRIRIRFPEGQAVWLAYTPTPPIRPPGRRWSGSPLQRDFLMVGVMALVGWLVVRLAMRPLQRMTEAAEKFGRDIAHPPIDESGPTEVRKAARAFNVMQEQIRSYMAERTQILAAVTHDLKTPMTRMRLRLENCPDEAFKDKLKADLGSMESLVEEGLELARSLNAVEPSQPVDLDALLQSLCDDLAESGMDVSYEAAIGGSAVILAQTNALRRVFENIIGNAVKYGRLARVRLEQAGGEALVKVRDAGPGIREDQLNEVLKPFVRLEGSRSRETGGTGLGFAIVVNLLKRQQGKLALHNHPQGGLEVSVQLPLIAEPV